MGKISVLKILVAIVVSALLLAFCFYLIGKSAKKSPNVIVILIDTLRADHLGLYGYERNTSPNLDILARESAVFSRAISTASWTPPGTTSVLSGLYPSAHTNQPPKRLSSAAQVGMKIPKEVKLLPELLKSKNYQTAALSSNPWISKEFEFDRGFDLFYYSKHIDAKNLILRSKKTINRFLQNKESPFFLYLHLIDPHAPYTAHPEYPFEGKLKVRDYSDKTMADINAYDSEIRFTDTQLGVFFEYLKSKGVYEDSIIVIVADHGEAFDEHGITGHGFNLHIEEVHIPLIIKGIGMTAVVSDSVSQVDIVPTILEQTGIEPPYPFAGVSLTNSEAIKKRSGVYSETYRVYRQRALSSLAGERLIMEMGDLDNPRETMNLKGLYDLNQDPFEANPIQDRLLHDELKGYLDSMIIRNIPLSTPLEVKIDSKTVEQLETLGYIN